MCIRFVNGLSGLGYSQLTKGWPCQQSFGRAIDGTTANVVFFVFWRYARDVRTRRVVSAGYMYVCYWMFP